MPASVLEAFASGCAVVATEAGGVPAILTNEQHGLLVPCDDHQAAAGAMIRLIEDPRAGAPPGRRGARFVRALPVVVGPRAVGRPLSPGRPSARPRGGDAGMSPAIRSGPPGGHGPRGAPLPAHLRSAQDRRPPASGDSVRRNGIEARSSESARAFRRPSRRRAPWKRRAAGTISRPTARSAEHFRTRTSSLAAGGSHARRADAPNPHTLPWRGT